MAPNFARPKRPKDQYVRQHLMLSRGAKRALETLAERDGVSLSQAADRVFLEAAENSAEYFAKQAAVQSFLGTGLMVAIGEHVLGKDRMEDLSRRATRSARRIYGPAPSRHYAVDPQTEDPDDPRALALYEAFGAE